jgi:hypothetical protein
VHPGPRCRPKKLTDLDKDSQGRIDDLAHPIPAAPT